LKLMVPPGKSLKDALTGETAPMSPEGVKITLLPAEGKMLKAE